MKRAYGWKPELPDIRDLPHVSVARPRQLPAAFMLQGFPPCWDQGDRGSCVGHGAGGAWWWERKKLGYVPKQPSRLFIYYNARAIEHTIKQDAGCAIRDGVKGMHKVGVCFEPSWPYVESKFDKRPAEKVFVEAAKHRVPAYRSVKVDETAMKLAIFEGFPVIAGFSVYDNFESDEVARTGVVGMPEGNLIGGHCILVIGWTAAGQFICRNSWGPDWGQAGNFLIPFGYLANRDLADDFWTLQP